jgi:hypothetical protein
MGRSIPGRAYAGDSSYGIRKIVYSSSTKLAGIKERKGYSYGKYYGAFFSEE